MNANKSTETRTLIHELLSRYLFLLVLIYGLTAVIIVGHIKIDFIDEALQKTEWPSETILRETFGNENVLFNQTTASQLQPVNVYHLLLEMMTDIRFDDPRSLFGAELPGFSLYNTKIFIAGKGLDYTNLPKDMPPPPEVELDVPKKAPDNDQPNKQPPANQSLKKTVFLYHTHPWESYKPALAGKKGASSATSYDSDLNVMRGGTEIGKVLNENGIGFLHDTSSGWGYNEAYGSSRQIIQRAMQKNKSLSYLIDIHRDAMHKKLTTLTLDGTTYARISFIIGEANPDYSANLYLAKQIKKRLDKAYPGIVRAVVGKTRNEGNGVYNQDLSKNALVVEIGGVDNTLSEVNRSSRAFAEALSNFIKEREK